MKRVRITVLVTAAAAVALLVPSGAAFAAPAPHAASVIIEVPSLIRIDRQDPVPSVTFTGVSKLAHVSVNWGDGSPVVTRHGRCTAAAAAAHRTGCPVTLTHTYASAGDFAVTATSGSLKSTATVTVAPKPVAWDPPAGWVQPANWSTFFGATFTPCENVTWFLDMNGQPLDRAGTKADIAAVLAMLSGQTGLTFTEVASADQAQLIYKWVALDGMGSGAVSLGPQGGSATVTMASDDPYTLDRHGGLGTVHFVYSDSSGTFEADVPGRGWFLTYLTGTALGLGPVSDPGQVMHTSYFHPGALGAGDLDGLHTMYASQPCPVIPD